MPRSGHLVEDVDGSLLLHWSGPGHSCKAIDSGGQPGQTLGTGHSMIANRPLCQLLGVALEVK
eukprot:4241353-Heterocapsa_arctica.AAC.1